MGDRDLTSQSASSGGLLRSEGIHIPICDFTYEMEWLETPIVDPEHWNWSFSVVRGDDGRWHGFGDRARETDLPFRGDVRCILQAHAKFCEIAHYVADEPAGPYRFVDVALAKGEQGAFDQSKIYPCVKRDGGRWAMMFSGVPGDHSMMRGCMAVADSLDGPWRNLGVIIEPSTDPGHWSYDSQVGFHVPQMIHFRGRWLAYFKAGTPSPDETAATDFVRVATADSPEGPWEILDKPAILKDGGHPRTYIEDHYEFVWNDRVYMVITDNFGRVSGVTGAILLFESDDGLTFPFDRVRLAVDQIQAYCPYFDPERVKAIWPPDPTWPAVFEAPRVVLVDGQPAYFFGCSGQNVDGVAKPGIHCLKIPNWR